MLPQARRELSKTKIDLSKSRLHMTSFPMKLLKSSTIAHAIPNNTRRIKVVALHSKTTATSIMVIKLMNQSHILTIDRNKTSAEVTDNSHMKNGNELSKMTANITISTKINAMSIQTLTVSFSGALMLVSARLAPSSKTNKPRGSRRLTSNRHKRAVLVFSQHTL